MTMSHGKAANFEYLSERRGTRSGKLVGIMSGLLILIGVFWLLVEFPEALYQTDSQGRLSSWPPRLTSHCASTPPIRHSEYLARQTSLAKTLHSLGAKAYIAEPGGNTQFFANFSDAQWTLSERPLLLVISPLTKESEDGKTQVLPEASLKEILKSLFNDKPDSPSDIGHNFDPKGAVVSHLSMREHLKQT